LIAWIFLRRGIIESWGRGTIKMAELMQTAGLPRPEIEEAAGCVVVRFRPSRYIPPRQVKQDLTERQQTILQFLSQHRWGVARGELIHALKLGKFAARDELDRLRTLDLIETYGHGRGAVWKLKS
jgi:ATP-dependent DNA helicase RecG